MLISDKGRKGLRKYAGEEFVGKLERWSKTGLLNYIGKGFPLGSEGHGVFRLGERSSLTRAGGFFEFCRIDLDRFIIIVVLKKRGQKFPQGVIDEIARVRDGKEWYEDVSSAQG